MATNYEQRMRRADIGRFNRRQISVEDVVLPQIDSEEDIKEQIQSAEIMENADVEFEVEGKVLKAVKVCLSMSSPVFKAMFKGDFKEKSASKIPLPGKAYADVLEFVEVIHSGRCVDDKNVEMVLPLAHEYDCKSLLQKCEGILVNKESSFDHLAMAGKYGLQKLQGKCVTDLLQENHCRAYGYDKIDSDTKVVYLERKLQETEQEFALLQKMKEKMQKLEVICSTNLIDVICSNTASHIIKRETLKDWPNVSQHKANYNDLGNAGDHMVGSKCDFCESCTKVRYQAMFRVVKSLH